MLILKTIGCAEIDGTNETDQMALYWNIGNLSYDVGTDVSQDAFLPPLKLFMKKCTKLY